MNSYEIEVLGAEIDDPVAYYLVTASDEATAMLLASMIDQYTPVRPISRKSPIIVNAETERELAKCYATVVRECEIKEG